MPKASPIQTAFSAGEFSPFMEGQINLDKRQDALLLCQNLIALKQGPIIRRGRTTYIHPVKNQANRTYLMDFEFSSSQAYQIETGDQYFRFLKNNILVTKDAQSITGITQANPAVVTYSGADNFTNGAEVLIAGVVGMTEVNGKYFTIANVNTGANTFELSGIDSTGYTAYTSGGTAAQVYEVTSPYLQADLFDSNGIFQIHKLQSADVLYLFHGSYKPRALARTSDNSWAINTLVLEDGPYLDTNTTSTTLTLSGTSGSVTVTASSTTGINGGSGFVTTDVGRIIRWRDPANNWTWLTITARTSTTQVTATISGANASATTATTFWRLGVYSDTTGWPRTANFFQDRLAMGGCSSFPDRYDLSKTGGYSPTSLLFAPSAANGTVADDNAISGNLPSKKVNRIQWIAPDKTGLVVGTTGQEWVIKSGVANEAQITPSNRTADPISTTRSEYIQALEVDTGFLFVQSARRKVFDAVYSFEIDKIKPRDVTLFADHITEGGVQGMCYQQEPINCIWSWTGAGLLLGLTYYPDQNIFGWHRHIIGGFSNSDQDEAAIVECASSISKSDGSRDEVTLIVRRYINGQTVRYIEVMEPYYDDSIAREDCFHADCSGVYSGSAVGTISGLEHLEGQTVKVMVDGDSHPDLVVASGQITLANSVTGTKIYWGLGYKWAFKTMQMEAGSADGTAQGKNKRFTRFVIRLLNTLGLKYGPDADNLDEYDFDYGQALDASTPLFSGDTRFLLWPGGYESKGSLYFENDGVFPACILCLMPQLNTYD